MTEATGANESGPRLEEIVVTAQRRVERLQDVPLAVSSLSAATLDQQGVTNTAELAQAVPSLVFTSTIGVASPFIRGVGSRLIDPTSESAVAVYVDDVYMAAPQANLFTLAGIKQIDVLAGPQGTLFGRNATGGVIQIQTLDPGHDPRFDASITYGNYDYVSGSAYASTGIGNDVATSLSFLYEDQGKGYGRNLYDGSPTFRLANDNITLRNKWVVNLPTNTVIRFSADYSRLFSTWAFQKSPGSFSQVPGAAAPTGYPGEYNANADQNDFTRIKAGGASLKIDQDFGPVTLTSISAYRENRSSNGLDQDLTTVRALNFAYTEKFHNYSQEIRINNRHSDLINWVIGAFYYDATGAFEPLSINGAVAIPFDQQKVESLAAFAQATVTLLPDTNLTGGFRYTTEDQEFAFPAARVALRQTAEQPTYRIALDHHFSRDILGYVSYNTGFKSGGYNLLQPGRSFQPEKLKSYEAGLKTELLDNRLRLNLAGFLYRYTNQQVSISSAGGSIVANAAGSRIKGIEANLDYQPDERLKISGGLTWIDSHYTNYPGFQLLDLNGNRIGAPTNVKGNTTLQTPKFVGNLSARYSLPTSVGEFVSSVGVQYNSGFWWDAGNLVRQPSYTIVNGSLSWTPGNSAFDIRVWGKNLLDSTYFLNRSIGTAPVGINQEQAPPRTFGVTLSYRYG